MKRFLLFAGSDYHPNGGWYDFYGSYDTYLEAIKEQVDEIKADWYHVVDTQIIEKVTDDNTSNHP